METSAPMVGVRVMPVMVVVNAWRLSCRLGSGGVAVRTKDTVALPGLPQLEVQTCLTPLHDARNVARNGDKLRNKAAAERRFFTVDLGRPECPPPENGNGEAGSVTTTPGGKSNVLRGERVGGRLQWCLIVHS